MEHSHIFNSTGYALNEPHIIKAEGMMLENSEGMKYLDFEAGVWCLPLGHSCKALNDSISKQIQQITHVGYSYSSDIVEEAAFNLLNISQFDDGKCVFLASGSEAVEYACQIAKKIRPNKKGLRCKNYYLSAYGNAAIQNDSWIEIDVDTANIEKLDFSQIGYFLFEPGNYSGLVKLPNIQFIQALV